MRFFSRRAPGLALDAIRFPNVVPLGSSLNAPNYDDQGVIWTVTLHTLTDGNLLANAISYDNFDQI